MVQDVLKTERHGRVSLLVMNRPERRNALSAELSARLRDSFLSAHSDPEIAAVVLTGAGTAFCAGADLKEARDADVGSGYRGPLQRPERSIYEVMLDCAKPIIAVINGPAVAGGFELALACDLRVVSTSASFGLPEAKRGMGANFASVLLPLSVPPGIAAEWMFTGRSISSSEAERWGLVNLLVQPEQALSAGMKIADEIAGNAPLSLQRMKLTYRKTVGMPLHSALRLEVGPDPYASEDRKEGARAFLERRQPVWQGR